MRAAVRLATPGDLPWLVRSLGQRYYFEDRLDRQRHRLGLILVAWLDGVPVGDVFLRLEPADEPELRKRLPGVALVQHLEVRSDYRNRGIGSRLLGAAEQALRDRGHSRVALGVALDNHDAVRLYHRHGYQEWPYPPISTTHETFLDGGGSLLGYETCQIFVKDLVL